MKFTCGFAHFRATQALSFPRDLAQLTDQSLVGHRPTDPATRASTPAAGQVQVSVDTATLLDPEGWELLAAEERPRPDPGSGIDAVIRTRRLR